MSRLEDNVKSVAANLNEPHYQKLLTLASSGRHIIISYPRDMTDVELLDFLGWTTHELRQSLPPTSGILVAKGRVDA